MTTASALADALADHFVDPKDPTSGVVLREVTAPNSSRRIDLLAVSLWSSRGYGIDAVEIKVDRADFQREIQNPAKAEPWWRCSNRFWIAAPSTSIANPAELPPGWGLLVPGKGRRFKIEVKAAERSLEVGMPLFTAILGRAVNAADAEYRRRLDRYRDQAHRDQQAKIEQLREEFAAKGDPGIRGALNTMREVEKAAGLAISEWSYKEHCTAEEFGAAVRTALETLRLIDEAEHAADVSSTVKFLSKKAGELAQAIVALEKVQAVTRAV